MDNDYIFPGLRPEKPGPAPTYDNSFSRQFEEKLRRDMAEASREGDQARTQESPLVYPIVEPQFKPQVDLVPRLQTEGTVSFQPLPDTRTVAQRMADYERRLEEEELDRMGPVDRIRYIRANAARRFENVQFVRAANLRLLRSKVPWA